MYRSRVVCFTACRSSGTAAALQVPELYAGRIDRDDVMCVFMLRLGYADLADDVSRDSAATIAEKLGIDTDTVQVADEVLVDLGLARQVGPEAYAVTGRQVSS